MKLFAMLICFSVIIFKSFGQYSIPPIAESDKKTEFSHTIFRVNYHTQKILARFLEQNTDNISLDVNSVRLVAKDLYYSSSEYQTEERLDRLVKGEYFTTHNRKLELLDSALSLSRKWRNAIVQNEELFNEMVLRAMYGFNFSVEGNSILAEGPPPLDGYGRSVYKFEFNEGKHLISKGLGRVTNQGEKLYWITTNYVYEKDVLVEETFKKCNDLTCKKGYELETTKYGDYGREESSKQTYSRHNNDFIFEEKTRFFYTNSNLDSAIIETFYMMEKPPKLTKVKTMKYQAGLTQSEDELSLSVERMRDQKSKVIHTYDDQNRLIRTEYQGWDNKLELSKTYVEEYEYPSNGYIYRYIEGLRIEQGKEKLPLQYEMHYTFTK